MRRFFITLVVIAIASATANAQEGNFRFPADPFSGKETETVKKDATTKPTSAEKSYASFDSDIAASNLVQKKAMHRAEQRQARITARKWYGFSQSRPVVNADPYMTAYTPVWVGRNWSPNYYRLYGSVWY